MQLLSYLLLVNALVFLNVGDASWFGIHPLNPKAADGRGVAERAGAGGHAGHHALPE